MNVGYTSFVFRVLYNSITITITIIIIRFFFLFIFCVCVHFMVHLDVFLSTPFYALFIVIAVFLFFLVSFFLSRVHKTFAFEVKSTWDLELVSLIYAHIECFSVCFFLHCFHFHLIVVRLCMLCICLRLLFQSLNHHS